MNWGFRIPLSASRRQSLQGATTVPAPRRRRLMLLVAASFAACAVAQAAPALGATVSIFATAASTVTEGDVGSTPAASFTVALASPVPGQTYTVDFATSNIVGGAVGGVDYTIVNSPPSPPCGAPSSCVTFGPVNFDSKTININVIGDNIDENGEQFNVILLNAVAPAGDPTFGIAAGGGSVTGTILDDDVTHFTINSVTVTEVDGPAGTSTADEELAKQVQWLEWQLLFDHCCVHAIDLAKRSPKP